MVISCALPNTRFIRASPSLYPLRTVQIAHRAPLCLATRLRLEPFGGDGDTSHIQDGIEVSPPPALDLKEGIFEVGRVDTADLIVPLPTVSARHCALQIEGGAVAVMDLGSTNGTFIDNIELKANKPARLNLGSQIIFGDKHLASFRLVEVEVEEPEPEAEPAPAPSE